MSEEAQSLKKKFNIDLYQTARIHTERFVEEFETRKEAEDFAREQCRDKGIEEDFEISDAEVEPENVLMPADISAQEQEAEAESEISPEGSDEKTTQENSLPVN